MFITKITSPTYPFATLALCIFMSLVPQLHAQQLEIHSTSDQAIQEVRTGMELLGHETNKFHTHMVKAHELDPNLLIANFFLGMNPDAEKEEAMEYVQLIKSYEGELSAGEKVFAEMASHFGEEDYEVGIQLKELADLYPEDGVLQQFVGMAFNLFKRPKEAIPYLKRAYELAELPGSANVLGYTYLQIGDTEQAQKYFEAYMETTSGHHNAYDSMGDFYMATKNYKAAAESFEKAAELHPEGAYHTEKAEKARGMMK